MALGLQPEGFVALYVGSLLKTKGVHLLLEAFAQGLGGQDQARLIFVGSGPEAAGLQEMAGKMGMAERVIVTGYRPRTELPDWYAASDVYVLPSQSEGLSMALLEAMASGRPVITTCSPDGSHDAVEDGIQGFLIRPGDRAALAAALATLVRAPDHARRMGAAARLQAIQRFSWNVVATQVASVYQAVATETCGGSYE